MTRKNSVCLSYGNSRWTISRFFNILTRNFVQEFLIKKRYSVLKIMNRYMGCAISVSECRKSNVGLVTSDPENPQFPTWTTDENTQNSDLSHWIRLFVRESSISDSGFVISNPKKTGIQIFMKIRSVEKHAPQRVKMVYETHVRKRRKFYNLCKCAP